MNWQTRLFILFWTAVTIILIGLMVMLYVSSVPHFLLLGGFATYQVICT